MRYISLVGALQASNPTTIKIPYTPYVVSLSVLVVLWIVYGAACGWNPLKLVEGADGRPSTSKFQFWLWTAVIVPTFCGLQAIEMKTLGFSAFNDYWPKNLLVVMGMSVITATAAKGITVGYISSNRLAKTSVPSGSTSTLVGILQDDDGFPDLSKVQMLAWTLIAVVIYLISIVHKFNVGDPKLPDIDNSLMVLMGLGQGAYLGKKLTTQDTCQLTSLSPNSVAIGALPADVTIVGKSFGDTQNGSLISLDGVPMALTVKSWSDTRVIFSFPNTQPTGTPWNKGQTALIGLLVGGQNSANQLPFSIV